MQNQPTTVTTVLTTGKDKYNPTVKTTVNNCSTKEVNHLLKECSDLISTDFKKWYALKFYSLDRDTIIKYASQARTDGNNPPKLFSYLLKKG